MRSLDYATAYNPVTYIEANWQVLTAIGGFSYPLFEQDLDNARQWMSIDDQPTVTFWGRALNDYAAPYPDFRIGLPAANPPLERTVNPLPERWQMRRLTYEGCCAGAWWGGANRLFAIDGSENQRAAIFEWNTDDGGLVSLIGQAPPPLLSPDGSLQVERINDQIVIRRVSADDDGGEWTVDTQNTLPAISPDNGRLAWEIRRTTTDPGDDYPKTEIWISALGGQNAHQITAATGAYARWLDGSHLLVGSRQQQATTLTVTTPVMTAVTCLARGTGCAA